MTQPLRRHTLRELPPSERPRERLLALGPAALSDAELLAILLRTGNRNETALQLAQRLLIAAAGQADDPLAYLQGTPAAELAGIPGVGPARAAQVKAALELGRRCRSVRRPAPVVRGPGDAARLLLPLMGDLDQEHFRVLLLDTKHHVLGIELVSIGGLAECSAHPREVFKAAIRRSAHAVILAHNHPSGELSPSPDDQALTRRLAEAGRLLGIEVLDHLIIGAGRYSSLRDWKPNGLAALPGA